MWILTRTTLVFFSEHCALWKCVRFSQSVWHKYFEYKSFWLLNWYDEGHHKWSQKSVNQKIHLWHFGIIIIQNSMWMYLSIYIFASYSPLYINCIYTVMKTKNTKTTKKDGLYGEGCGQDPSHIYHCIAIVYYIVY